MRTRTWLWALSATAVPAALFACGDSGDGTGGMGGLGTSIATTGAVTSSKGSSTSKASTSVTNGSTVSSNASVSTASTSNSSTTSSTTSSSSSGAGGQGADTCPGGQALDLAVNSQILIHGDTTNAADDLKTFCAKGAPSDDAPDVVYKFHTAAECSLTATLNETGFDGVLSLRSTCDTRAGASFCFDGATHGETLREDVGVGDHWMVVDGATTSAFGAFDLTLACATPVCGDGIVNSGEQCDDTSASCGQPNTPLQCQIIAPAAADTCATAQTISINPGMTFIPPLASARFTNFGAADDYNPIPSASCPFVAAVGPNQSAPDVVFDLLPTAPGTMTITIGFDNMLMNACDSFPDPGCWNSGLFVQQGTCGVAVAPVACAVADYNVAGNNGLYTVSFPVTDITTHYYVFVKSPDAIDMSANTNTGSFYLEVTL